MQSAGEEGDRRPASREAQPLRPGLGSLPEEKGKLVLKDSQKVAGQWEGVLRDVNRSGRKEPGKRGSPASRRVEGHARQGAVLERPFWLPWGRVDQWWLDRLGSSWEVPRRGDEAEAGKGTQQELGWGGDVTGALSVLAWRVR